MNGYPVAVASKSTWSDIAAAVNRITQCGNHSGYMFKGERSRRWPIGVHVYAIDSDFSNLVSGTIAQWVANAQQGVAQKQPDPLPDPSNVGDEDPDISDTDEDEPGPSSGKRPKTGPSKYCSNLSECGGGEICGSLNLGATCEVVFGIVASAVKDIGSCITDPFASVATRSISKRRITKRADDDYWYGTPSDPHLGQSTAQPICNADLYGKPLNSDCSNAARAMEEDNPDIGSWSRPTSYFGQAAVGVQEQQTATWGYLKVPRTYYCGTCVVAINVGHNPLPDNEHDVASKKSVKYAANNLINSCLHGGPTARLKAGGLVIAGERQKLWITAFHVPNLPRDLAKRRSRGYVNVPAVNDYLRTCDWPGGGSVKRTGVSCVVPNGIDDDLDQAQPVLDDATFAAQMKAELHLLAQDYGQLYCSNDEACGLGFQCQALATTNFSLLLGVVDSVQTGSTNGTGICIERPL
ncbi:MAG: hypothetical protein M1812_006965 [Candelaria pacifica]|nr:MAG: hypothetical protein M1812_006965 [Candelaria pacifica]